MTDIAMPAVTAIHSGLNLCLMHCNIFIIKVARLQGCKWVYGFAILH